MEMPEIISSRLEALNWAAQQASGLRLEVAPWNPSARSGQVSITGDCIRFTHVIASSQRVNGKERSVKTAI